VTKLSPVRGPSQAVLEREKQRLAKLAKAERKQSKLLNKEQMAQIRRFTQGSRLRRVVTWTSIGSVLALVALVLATMFTPLMAIEEIKISGVHRMKVSAVRNAVKSLVGTPLTLVDENAIAKRLEGFPLIESFTTISLPPHTLELNILERQPIGLVSVGGNTYLYDPAGVRIEPARGSSRYPRIIVNGDPAHSTSYREAVDVLLALPAKLYPNIYSIEATTKDNVLLTIRGASNRRIIWGDSSDSLLKSKVLAALMKHTKHSATVTFDVSSPNTPTVRYGNY
jgi:cell division protein FtsQ